MTDDSKICENRRCGKTFRRRNAEGDDKWAVRRYCQPKCAIEVRGNERTVKVPDTPDRPTHPVPVGQTWRPVGFASAPDHAARPAIRRPAATVKVP